MIRRAAAEDVPAILSLAALSETASLWPESEYHALQKYGCLGVCYKGHVLAGFVAARVTLPKIEGEIESIVVRPALRRQGIGHALCAWALREMAVVEVHLEVRASNKGAQALYTALGFTESGRRRHYYRAPDEDAVIMHLSSMPSMD
jgi:ribosomal-protein-alanine N-acetyltransferase